MGVLRLGPAGAAMNIVGSTRNIIFTKMVEKGKDTKILRAVFSAVFIIFCLATWDGVKSILVGIAKVISTFAYGSSSTAFVRIMIFFTSTAWLIYNLMVGSYAGFACEAFTLCSIIAGIIRIDIMKKAKPSE
mgnify:FL=1